MKPSNGFLDFYEHNSSSSPANVTKTPVHGRRAANNSTSKTSPNGKSGAKKQSGPARNSPNGKTKLELATTTSTSLNDSKRVDKAGGRSALWNEVEEFLSESVSTGGSHRSHLSTVDPFAHALTQLKFNGALPPPVHAGKVVQAVSYANDANTATTTTAGTRQSATTNHTNLSNSLPENLSGQPPAAGAFTLMVPMVLFPRQPVEKTNEFLESYVKGPPSRFTMDATYSSQPIHGTGTLTSIAGDPSLSFANMKANLSVANRFPAPAMSDATAKHMELMSEQEQLTAKKEIQMAEIRKALAKLVKENEQLEQELLQYRSTVQEHLSSVEYTHKKQFKEETENIKKAYVSRMSEIERKLEQETLASRNLRKRANKAHEKSSCLDKEKEATEAKLVADHKRVMERCETLMREIAESASVNRTLKEEINAREKLKKKECKELQNHIGTLRQQIKDLQSGKDILEPTGEEKAEASKLRHNNDTDALSAALDDLQDRFDALCQDKASLEARGEHLERHLKFEQSKTRALTEALYSMEEKADTLGELQNKNKSIADQLKDTQRQLKTELLVRKHMERLHAQRMLEEREASSSEAQSLDDVFPGRRQIDTR